MELLYQHKDLLHATHPGPSHPFHAIHPCVLHFGCVGILLHEGTPTAVTSDVVIFCLLSLRIIYLESIHVLCYPNFITFYH